MSARGSRTSRQVSPGSSVGEPSWSAPEARSAAGVDQLGSPTLDPGETWRDVREPRADTEALAQRGLAYEHLDQIALEYLYGVRP